jgi:hypothetical protein
MQHLVFVTVCVDDWFAGWNEIHRHRVTNTKCGIDTVIDRNDQCSGVIISCNTEGRNLYSTNISFEAILASFYYKFFYGSYKSTNPDPN